MEICALAYDSDCIRFIVRLYWRILFSGEEFKDICTVNVGAVSNIILNLVLTPILGALGAAIATAVCYFVVWVMRYWHSKKFIKLRINLGRDLVTYVLLVVQSVILLILDGIVMYGVEVGLLLLIMLLYAGDLMAIVNKGKKAIIK